MENFKVVEFKFASSDDEYNLKYDSWSRLYEYTYVINFIKKNLFNNENKIHNTSWGFEGDHVTFRDELDKIGSCLHSDIVHSIYRETYYYDITQESEELNNSFDFVINISTLEHLKSLDETKLAISNLFKQVKIDGYLILTFDYPRINLSDIEKMINFKCFIPDNILNGKNSIKPNANYENLNIVYLILKRNG